MPTPTSVAETVYRAQVAKLEKRLNRAMNFLRDEVKKSINIGSPPPSLPREPPHKLWGRLFQSITAKPAELRGSQLVAAVGTNVIYARRLELGYIGTTRANQKVHQAPRPFLRPALHRNAERIRELLLEP